MLSIKRGWIHNRLNLPGGYIRPVSVPPLRPWGFHTVLCVVVPLRIIGLCVFSVSRAWEHAGTKLLFLLQKGVNSESTDVNAESTFNKNFYICVPECLFHSHISVVWRRPCSWPWVFRWRRYAGFICAGPMTEIPGITIPGVRM